MENSTFGKFRRENILLELAHSKAMCHPTILSVSDLGLPIVVWLKTIAHRFNKMPPSNVHQVECFSFWPRYLTA